MPHGFKALANKKATLYTGYAILVLGFTLPIRIITLALVKPQFIRAQGAVFLPLGLHCTVAIESVLSVLAIIAGVAVLRKKASLCIVSGLLMAIANVAYYVTWLSQSYDPDYRLIFKLIAVLYPGVSILVYGLLGYLIATVVRRQLKDA